jgi:hypothetical protein
MPLGEFRAVFLPYCLKKLPDGRYVVLNRRYKPLGFTTKGHVIYEDYPIAVRFKGLTAKVAAKISCRGDTNLDEIHLYHDGSIPTSCAANMQAYLSKLAVLAKLSVVDDER